MAAFSAVLFMGAAHAEDEGKAISPKDEPVNLMADPSFSDFVWHFNEERSLTTERDEVWSIEENGQLKVSGKAYGYIRTKQKYRDYHLVLEYTWGEKTWAGREDRARDCGILVHAYGEDGNFGDTWITSIEAQLIEGGSGDFLVLSPRGDTEGENASLTVEVGEDRDGNTVWKPGGEKKTFEKGRINWQHRDPDWKDVKDFRGEKEVENLPGEWNRMEVICRDGSIRILLNGEIVNEGTDAKPTEGYVCLQSEGAEMWVRRYELWPLDSFKEKWTEEDVKDAE
ncbi:MAG: DUF1080 domain-containing protein [Verrucomicrobiales bacterium]